MFIQSGCLVTNCEYEGKAYVDAVPVDYDVFFFIEEGDECQPVLVAERSYSLDEAIEGGWTVVVSPENHKAILQLTDEGYDSRLSSLGDLIFSHP